VVHDGDAIGKTAHDIEIVADEHDRHTEALLQVGKKIEDLRLHRHVECGGGLVRDQQIGFVGHCHGDHHTLALSAGQFVRIGIDPVRCIGNAYEFQQLDRAPAC